MSRQKGSELPSKRDEISFINQPPAPLSHLFNDITTNLAQSKSQNSSILNLIQAIPRENHVSSPNLLKNQSVPNQLKRSETDIALLALSNRPIDCIPESKVRYKKQCINLAENKFNSDSIENILNSINQSTKANPNQTDNDRNFRRHPSYANYNFSDNQNYPDEITFDINKTPSDYPMNSNDELFDSTNNFYNPSPGSRNDILNDFYEDNHADRTFYPDNVIPIPNNSNNFLDKKKKKKSTATKVIKKTKVNKEVNKYHEGWIAKPFTPPTASPIIGTSSNTEKTTGRYYNVDGVDFLDLRSDQPVPPPIDLKTVKANKFINDSDDTYGKLPPRLEHLIESDPSLMIQKDSITYLALCGSDIVGYQEKLVNEALWQLRNLLNKCITLGFITESKHVKTVLDHINQRLKEIKRNDPNTKMQINENLAKAKQEKEKREKEWESRHMSIENEYNLLMNDLGMRYNEDKKKLDQKFKSVNVQSRFNKPSAQLNNMKYMAHQMLTLHQFDDASSLAQTIEKNQESESEEASNRLKKAYQCALDQLNKKYEIERTNLTTSFNTRKSALKKSEKSDLLPFDRRVQKFSQKKEDFDYSLKRNQEFANCYSKKKRPGTAMKQSQQFGSNLTINLHAKLNLTSAISSKKPKIRVESRLSRPPRPASQMKNRTDSSQFDTMQN